MSAPPASLFSLTPRAFWAWGRLALGGAFAFGLLLLALITWAAPHLLPVFPLLLLVPVGAWHLFQRPMLNLFVGLAAFVLAAAHDEGLSVFEVLYGLYFLGFLAHWFVTRVFLYREHVFREPEDKALLLFLVGATLTIPLSVLYGAEARMIVSEWTALLMLAAYFPVKEAMVRYRRAPLLLLVALGWIGIFVALRNGFLYREALRSAEMAWQIARGRVVMNDSLLMVLSVMTLVLVSFARDWKQLVVLLGIFVGVFAGLILTQSRGNWVAFAFGAFVLFVVVDRTRKRAMLRLLTVGGGTVLVLALVFLGEHVQIVAAGLFQRFASLQTALTDDVSLVNRFRETAAAWEHIVRNPVLGRGVAVPYTFFDLAHMSTDKDSFIHNGYVALWYRFGLWGLLLMLFAWIRLGWRGLQAYRTTGMDLLGRLCGLAAFCALTALTLTTITSNPFFLKDALLMFGVLLGLAGGAYERARRASAPATPAAR